MSIAVWAGLGVGVVVEVCLRTGAVSNTILAPGVCSIQVSPTALIEFLQLGPTLPQ